YLPLVAAIILLFCGVSQQIFQTYSDALRYQCYARLFWHGSQGIQQLPDIQCSFLTQFNLPAGGVPPFHVLPFEYPPFTLSIFSLPLILPLPYYQIVFAVLMACVALGVYWLLLRYGPQGSSVAYALYLVLGAWATAEGRFDLVPAGLTLLAVIAAERRRWTLAYIALALGSLLKIYPILLLPALFLAEQITAERISRPPQSLTLKTLPGEIWHALCGARRWRWRNALLFFGLILGVSGIFAVINFQGAVISQLSYFAGRPVEIESTGSTVLWLATLIGHPANVVYTFGSVNIDSDLDDFVALAFDLLFLCGVAWTILWQWRGRFDLAQAFIALLLVFMATGKVLSPQYLIWLIPLLAYSGAFNRLWLILWGSVCLLTTIIYPFLFSQVVDVTQLATVPGFIEIVSLRNILLILVTLAFFFNWWSLNQRKIPALLPH
ncbi:MAG: glycosyltransferase 87 family protein, partial [Ktedonobacteraceae bacterium]